MKKHIDNQIWLRLLRLTGGFSATQENLSKSAFEHLLTIFNFSFYLFSSFNDFDYLPEHGIYKI